MMIEAMEAMLAHDGTAKSMTDALNRCPHIIEPWVAAGSLVLTP